MELEEWSWFCLLSLFVVSLLVVLLWFSQFLLTLWRTRRAAEAPPGAGWRLLLTQPGDSLARGASRLLLKLRSMGGVGGARSEAGVKGLLSSLLSFQTFRNRWQDVWIKALNEEACRHGSSIQISFDCSETLSAACTLHSVSCSHTSAHRVVFHCNCSVDTVMFPVTVTQQSHAVVAVDTFLVTMAPMEAQVIVSLQEVEDEGLLVSWTFSKQTSFSLTVSPNKPQRPVSTEADAHLHMIKVLIEDTLFSAHPAMVLTLKTGASPRASTGVNTPPHSLWVRRLLLRHLRVTFSKGQWPCPAELCCVVGLDQPPTERSTRFLTVPQDPDAALEWSDELSLELSPGSKELKVQLLERSGGREHFLPGSASLGLDPQRPVPTGPHVWTLGSPENPSTPTATITAQLLCTEREDTRSLRSPTPLRSSLTPTKKVDVDRTIMSDGTIVTTVTTVQSRLRLDRSPGASPLCSPSKVEVTEKMSALVSDGSSPNPSNAALRQLTESATKPTRRTPTKRSTLIISGVSKVRLSEDSSLLSSGYAAAMDAAIHSNHFVAGRPHDVDETTRSDMSERPSVDEVESDTGSTGGYETRSLKDHKVGFLQSGTKRFFRRRHRQKEACVSQSHEDVSNIGNNFSADAGPNRKKSGSFSRRLIKRFSFRSSGKSKGKTAAANGGATSLDK